MESLLLQNDKDHQGTLERVPPGDQQPQAQLMNEYQLMELFALTNEINLIDLIVLEPKEISSAPHSPAQFPPPKGPAINELKNFKWDSSLDLFPSWIDFIQNEINKNNYSEKEEEQKTFQEYENDENEKNNNYQAQVFELTNHIPPHAFEHPVKNPLFCNYKNRIVPLKPDLPSKSSNNKSSQKPSWPSNDMDLLHLYLQIKTLPIFKLLQHSNKIITSEHWNFALEEIKLLKLLARFQYFKEQGFSQMISNLSLFNPFVKSQDSFLSTACHGRVSKSHWDFLLEEMVWMSLDFSQERQWKFKACKQASVFIKASKKRSQVPCNLLDDDDAKTTTLIPSKKFKSHVDMSDDSEPYFYYEPQLLSVNENSLIYGPPSLWDQSHLPPGSIFVNTPNDNAFALALNFPTKEPDVHENTITVLSLPEKPLCSHGSPVELRSSVLLLPSAKDKLDLELLSGSSKVAQRPGLESLVPWTKTEDKILLDSIKFFHTHINWTYISDFLNSFFYNNKCIRSSNSAQARLLKLRSENSKTSKVGDSSEFIQPRPSSNSSNAKDQDYLKGHFNKTLEVLTQYFSIIKKKQASRSSFHLSSLLLQQQQQQQQSLSCRKNLFTSHPSHENALKKPEILPLKSSFHPFELSLKKLQKTSGHSNDFQANFNSNFPKTHSLPSNSGSQTENPSPFSNIHSTPSTTSNSNPRSSLGNSNSPAAFSLAASSLPLSSSSSLQQKISLHPMSNNAGLAYNNNPLINNTSSTSTSTINNSPQRPPPQPQPPHHSHPHPINYSLSNGILYPNFNPNTPNTTAINTNSVNANPNSSSSLAPTAYVNVLEGSPQQTTAYYNYLGARSNSTYSTRPSSMYINNTSQMMSSQSRPGMMGQISAYLPQQLSSYSPMTTQPSNIRSVNKLANIAANPAPMASNGGLAPTPPIAPGSLSIPINPSQVNYYYSSSNSPSHNFHQINNKPQAFTNTTALNASVSSSNPTHYNFPILSSNPPPPSNNPFNPNLSCSDKINLPPPQPPPPS